MNKILALIALVAALLIAVVLSTEDRAESEYAVDPRRTTTTVAVVLTGPRNDGGWSEAHYRAFETIKDELNLKVTYMENVPGGEDGIPHIRDAVKRGAKIVFATSFGFGDAVTAVAEEYPEAYFYHCTGIRESANVATYMGRMYQMRYLSGLAAGLHTRSNHLGYVAALPIHEVVRGINAFALGARKANPAATIHVFWTGEWINPGKESHVVETLLDSHPIDVLAYHQDSHTVMQTADQRRVAAIGYHQDMAKAYPDTCLTSLVWNWAPFYRRAVMAVQDGSFRGRRYWEGVASGTVGLTPIAGFAEPGISAQVDAERQKLVSGVEDVFDGPLSDVDGLLRVEAGASLSDEQMLSDFDWFVPGVVLEN